MSGILYGIGVGPGDPEQMTLKAIRVIRSADMIAAPGEAVKETQAYRVAVQAVPEMEEKVLLPLKMPMSMDRQLVEEAHRNNSQCIINYLEQGLTVGFLTLGDPTIYSTFSYLEKIIRSHGYRTEYVNGITSFCAAAASFHSPLCEWQEQLHIIPASHHDGHQVELPGTHVFMKNGKNLQAIREMIQNSGRRVMMIENCTLHSERKYDSVEEIPDEAPYLSLIITKEQDE